METQRILSGESSTLMTHTSVYLEKAQSSETSSDEGSVIRVQPVDQLLNQHDAEWERFSTLLRQEIPDAEEDLREGLKLLAEDGFASGIKRLRLQAGLTQQQLAAALQTSQPYIARVESGDHDLQYSTMRKLADALEVDISAIVAVLEG